MKHNLEIDNRSLVAECLKGNREALNLFYVRFSPLMLSVIRRYVPDNKDAEDILHDGFIIAFTQLGSLRNYDRVQYWLASIMKNLSLQFLSSQDVVAMLHELPEIEDTPEIDDIIGLDTLEMLICKLPAGYQKVFRLAVLENKSHKEISKLLGIAPNSSSSQLFHAKILMRKLIMEHKRQTGLLSFIILAATAGFLYWNGRGLEDKVVAEAIQDTDKITVTDNRQPENNKQPEKAGISNGGKIIVTETLRNSEPVADIEPSQENIAETVAPVIPDTVSEIVEPIDNQTIVQNENVRNVKNDSVMLDENLASYYAYLNGVSAVMDDNKTWSFKVAVQPGFNPVKFGNVYSDIDNVGSSNPGPPDYGEKDDGNEDKKKVKPEEDLDYNDISHHNYIPISVAFTFDRKFSDRVSLESGLVYTFLHSSFENGYAKSHCYWHYIGIPFKVRFETYSVGRMSLYASAGGEVSIPVYAKAEINNLPYHYNMWTGRFNAGVVWSFGASYGISLRVSDKVSVFVEPTLQYYVPRHQKVPNYRTDNHWGFSLPFGFRFNL